MSKQDRIVEERTASIEREKRKQTKNREKEERKRQKNILLAVGGEALPHILRDLGVANRRTLLHKRHKECARFVFRQTHKERAGGAVTEQLGNGAVALIAVEPTAAHREKRKKKRDQ